MIKTKEELIEKLNGAVVHCKNAEENRSVSQMLKKKGFHVCGRNAFDLKMIKSIVHIFDCKFSENQIEWNNFDPDRYTNVVSTETFLSWFEDESKMKITENEGDYTIDIGKRVNVIPEQKPLTTYIERAEANANLIRERLGKASEDLELEDVCSFDKGTFTIKKNSLSISEARRLGEWLVKATKVSKEEK